MRKDEMGFEWKEPTLLQQRQLTQQEKTRSD